MLGAAGDKVLGGFAREYFISQDFLDDYLFANFYLFSSGKNQNFAIPTINHDRGDFFINFAQFL